jgi:hypothetical protein
MRSAVWVAAIATAACSFDGASGSGGDGGAGGCRDLWGERAFFDCEDLPESSGPLRVNGVGFIDTTTGELFINGQSRGIHGVEVALGGRVVRLMVFDSLEVIFLGVLRAEGEPPLLLAVEGDAQIVGDLDVSSRFDEDAYSPGAGADPDGCPDPTAETPDGLQGEQLVDGGGGGGGGGFGGPGGPGGDGRTGNASGAPGGLIVDMTTPTVRGGCPGGRGGEGDDQTAMNPEAVHVAGAGGPGGGAVVLSAAGVIEIRGAVLAGGAGGRGQTMTRRHGGGGGGSGGMIALEAPAIEIDDGAVLAANGGGGGGGADTLTHPSGDAMLTGAEGLAGDGAARGAPGGDTNPTAAGGDGGAGSTEPGGEAGTASERGGGGGGGGVGYIFIIGERAVHDGATVSPDPTRAPNTLNRDVRRRDRNCWQGAVTKQGWAPFEEPQRSQRFRGLASRCEATGSAL